MVDSEIKISARSTDDVKVAVQEGMRIEWVRVACFITKYVAGKHFLLFTECSRAGQRRHEGISIL